MTAPPTLARVGSVSPPGETDRPPVGSLRETGWLIESPADRLPTNAIESLNARFRRAVRHRGHFPSEQAALKVLYLIANRRRPNRSDLVGRINGWKQILNALMIHYGDRLV